MHVCRDAPAPRTSTTETSRSGGTNVILLIDSARGTTSDQPLRELSEIASTAWEKTRSIQPSASQTRANHACLSAHTLAPLVSAQQFRKTQQARTSGRPFDPRRGTRFRQPCTEIGRPAQGLSRVVRKVGVHFASCAAIKSGATEACEPTNKEPMPRWRMSPPLKMTDQI